jgi:hypothetical protein
MGTLRELKTAQQIVEQVLLIKPETRNSDDLLYYWVCETINRDAVAMPFYQVIANRKAHGLPSYESVGRIRRLIQSNNPSLRAKKKVAEMREANEEVYKEFAKGCV